jgi:hypothetical protein
MVRLVRLSETGVGSYLFAPTREWCVWVNITPVIDGKHEKSTCDVTPEACSLPPEYPVTY